MEFKILSHASMLVSCGGTKVVIDPWLLGSCYWRSWWNFPRAVFDESEIADVDAVIISHVHWDHWHGPTLKKYFAGKPIIIPDEPSLRSETDLRSIGFENIRRVRHGETIQVGELAVTLHQFGRYLNDSAVVIQGDGVTLLNANDAKIAGLSLRNVISRHGPIDFAFRSHSSANTRVCYHMEGGDPFVADEREHYFRSFVHFMNAVKPRYAVPFASNHCHLHNDVFQFNSYVSNPLQLREYCTGRESDWALQVMLPGSSWVGNSGKTGEFSLASEEPFAELSCSLETYRLEQSATLERYKRQENAVEVTPRTLDRFMGFFISRGKSAPRLGSIKLALKWPDGRRQGYICNLDQLTYTVAMEAGRAEVDLPMLEIPAIVFRDSVIKNMFAHAGISKRCRYIAVNSSDMQRLETIVGYLDRHELGLYPFSWRYRLRLASTYVRRWRELIVYTQALWLLKVKKLPIYLVEEEILTGKF